MLSAAYCLREFKILPLRIQFNLSQFLDIIRKFVNLVAFGCFYYECHESRIYQHKLTMHKEKEY